jgi:hypothetical protein
VVRAFRRRPGFTGTRPRLPLLSASVRTNTVRWWDARRGTRAASSTPELSGSFLRRQEPMQRMFLAVALALALAPSALAQLAGGNITGTIQDDQGGVLPGVTVTLQGADITRTSVTDEAGVYRFLNLAPGSYRVAAAMQGFTTVVRDGVVVTVGSHVDLPVRMKVATVEETVTVTGESPIVDARATGTATNFTQDELARIPTSRDPWALLRTVPGVQMDRVNIAGNETGQQSNFNSKGSSRNDTVWTMDGVQITDMSAIGASPSYFDFDTFDEIQISTSGQDIRQPTGGAGLNLVVKRGTNAFRGTARGYFTSDELEAENVPDELRAIGITAATADHNDQISDIGIEAGGPIVRDKAWIWGSIANQDIRLVRAAGGLIDRTLLKTYNIKGNYQATNADMFSALWFLGAKEKFGRPGAPTQRYDPTAAFNQGNLYSEGRPNGLLKIEHNRTFGSSLFVNSKFASYDTGFTLAPIGGLEMQSTVSTRLGHTFGSLQDNRFLRPQTVVNADANHFRQALGGNHDISFGFSWRRHDATTNTVYPGNMIQGYDNSDTDRRGRVWREGLGTNRTEYLALYVGDTFQRGRLTLNAGLRFDRQDGAALASDARANAGLPTVVPGISFSGYDTPFTWNTVLPRIGVTYALDETSKTLLRANFSMYASQLDATTVGFSNPSVQAGYAEYPWADANGDNFVQPGEVNTAAAPLSFAGGFNPAAPTSVRSSDLIDADLKAPITKGLVIGIDREIMPNFGVQVNCSWSRTDDIVGSNNNGDGISTTFVPWVGLTRSDYTPGEVLTGTLPNGEAYAVQTWIPDAAKVAANGNSRILTNWDGYHVTYNGLELSAVKRMSNRWMARAALAWNNPREYWQNDVNVLGNPTRTDTSHLEDGGPYATRSAGSGAGDGFVHGRWQVNINGAYQLPYGLEVAGNLFGRQGNPFPIFRTASLGVDGSQRVLVSPSLDTFRLDDIWNLDLRGTKYLQLNRVNLTLVADLFNVLNANMALNRQRNVGTAATFNRITQNLSPRIVRFGVRIGF